MKDEQQVGLGPLGPSLPVPRDRIHLQKSSVCSRSYFVVVMVFFHVYIINVIALLLYVHYNSGPGEPPSPGPGAGRAPEPDPLPPVSHAGPGGPLYLPRIEGIRVGHVQKVALVPNKVHEMKTLSLKSLLFERVQDVLGRCGLLQFAVPTAGPGHPCSRHAGSDISAHALVDMREDRSLSQQAAGARQDTP